MFNVDQFVNNPLLGIIFKLGSLTILGMYIIFLFVVLKQVRSMNTIITQPDLFPIIQTAAIMLIAFAIFLFLLGVVIL